MFKLYSKETEILNRCDNWTSLTELARKIGNNHISNINKYVSRLEDSGLIETRRTKSKKSQHTITEIKRTPIETV